MMNRLGLVLVMFAAACGVSDNDASDGESDRFVTGDGKTDTGGIQEGTPGALGVLHVVNTLTEAQLASQVQLAAAAAKNIAAYRTGDDETAATSDDETFDSLRELDSIPFVGAVAFGKLLAYAEAEGFTDDPPGAPSTTDDPFDPNACQGAPMSQVAAKNRLQVGSGTLGSYQIQMRRRKCTGTTSTATCEPWVSYDLNQVDWRTKASGLLELGNYNGQVKLQMKHGICSKYGEYIPPVSTFIDGAVCDGVGHTLYCGSYGRPQICDSAWESSVKPYELPNGLGFAMEGKVTENCAQLRKAVRNYSGSEYEVALLVRF